MLVPHDHDGGPEGSNLWFVVEYRFDEPALPLQLEYRLPGGPIDVTVGDVTGVDLEEPGAPVDATVIGRGAISAEDPVVLFAPGNVAGEEAGGASTGVSPWVWAGAAAAGTALVVLAVSRGFRTRRTATTRA